MHALEPAIIDLQQQPRPPSGSIERSLSRRFENASLHNATLYRPSCRRHKAVRRRYDPPRCQFVSPQEPYISVTFPVSHCSLSPTSSSEHQHQPLLLRGRNNEPTCAYSPVVLDSSDHRHALFTFCVGYAGRTGASADGFSWSGLLRNMRK